MKDPVKVVDGNVVVYFPPGHEVPRDKSPRDLVTEQMENFWQSPDKHYKRREALGTPESVAPYLREHKDQ